MIHSSKLEQNKNSQHDTCGVTAVSAVLEAGPELRPKCKTGKFCIKTRSKKNPKRKIIRVLLDSGLDGDLMFHKKEQLKAIPT